LKIEVLKSLEIPTYPSGKGGKMKVQKLTANICEIKWQPGVSIALNVCRCVRVCVCGRGMSWAYKMLTVNKLLANWRFDGKCWAKGWR